MNLPNAITFLRLVLAVILFVLIDIGRDWAIAALLFCVAAGTDWLDGYLARRLQQVTTLGRIMDPFVDKIIVGGSFIFLLKYHTKSGIGPWLVVTIIGREMLISSLRGILEQRGTDFSASFSGKLKMVCQCAAVAVALLSMHDAVRRPWLLTTRDVILWSTVAVTIWSGLDYIIRASRLLNQSVKEDAG